MEEIYTPQLFMSISDRWNSILKSGDDIEEVRTNLLNHVNERHFKSYSDADNEVSNLDLIIIRDCARAWRGVLHVRSEKLAGFSVLLELVKAARGRPIQSSREHSVFVYQYRGVERARCSP